MGIIIPFRRGAARPDEAKSHESRAKATYHARTALRATGVGFLRMIRFVSFLLLLTLRRPIHFAFISLVWPSELAFTLGERLWFPNFASLYRRVGAAMRAMERAESKYLMVELHNHAHLRAGYTVVHSLKKR